MIASPMPRTVDSETGVSDRSRVVGLYAVTPDLLDTAHLLSLVEAAIEGGARVVQYRNKIANPTLLHGQAQRLGALCRALDVPLIVNDHLELALAVAGAGLHVGAEDVAGPAALAGLRQRLGAGRLLGVSCYRSLELAQTAMHADADYVAFGSLFPSTTKPHAPPAPLSLFADARVLGVATVGIGGIDRSNISSVAAAGADATAVIGDLFASGEPATVRERARALAARFRAARRAFLFPLSGA